MENIRRSCPGIKTDDLGFLWNHLAEVKRNNAIGAEKSKVTRQLKKSQINNEVIIT